MSAATERLGPLGPAVEAAVGALADDGAVERLWGRDHTFWQDDPTEVADRLGWLESPAEMLDRAGEVESFAIGLAGNGFSHAVLMGMGGSSLFPEVVAHTFGAGSGALSLHVLDTTDPAAVLRIEESLPLDDTLFVAASKSGTTVETRSHLAYFWDRLGRPDQFAAVTDPGSPLASLARDRGFRAVFENRPDIGGRYSALSHFGLVPAALVGTGVEELLHEALDMADQCRRAERENPGVRLGAIMATAAQRGRDKLTVRLGERIVSFGAWIEQLVAESTGKEGVGVLPVVDEAARAPEAYGDDRVFVLVGEDESDAGEALAAAGHPVLALPSTDPYSLGGEVMRWEVATAVAGRMLGINPFDQPDVQAAKEATERVLREEPEEIPLDSLDAAVSTVGPGDYLAVQAFVDPGSAGVPALRAAADCLGERLGVATTLGLGPRYLHSTGQLHKGGPATGVFVQVVGDDPRDLEIPGAGYSFAELKRAQATGDFVALRQRGRRIARVPLDELLSVDAT